MKKLVLTATTVLALGALVTSAEAAGKRSGIQQPGIRVLPREPDKGALNFGQIVYVDNGYCQGNTILEVSGAYSLATQRGRRCVVRR